jgi:hypothetical protein
MTLKERVDQHDGQIAAIRKLILQGMKMMNKNEQLLNRNEQQLNLLTAEVRAFIAGMRKGGKPNWQS